MISGDCLQNWAVPDDYTSWLAKPMMKMMGLIKPYNIGPRWFERGKPPKDQMRALLDLAYENVLPGHGTPVLGGAAGHYRAAIERVTADSVRDEAELDLIDDERVRCRSRLDPQQQAAFARSRAPA